MDLYLAHTLPSKDHTYQLWTRTCTINDSDIKDVTDYLIANPRGEVRACFRGFGHEQCQEFVALMQEAYDLGRTKGGGP